MSSRRKVLKDSALESDSSRSDDFSLSNISPSVGKEGKPSENGDGRKRKAVRFVRETVLPSVRGAERRERDEQRLRDRRLAIVQCKRKTPYTSRTVGHKLHQLEATCKSPSFLVCCCVFISSLFLLDVTYGSQYFRCQFHFSSAHLMSQSLPLLPVL